MNLFRRKSKNKTHQENSEESLEIYEYKEIPEKLRVQIMYIWKQAIGPYVKKNQYSFDFTNYIGNKIWPELRDFLREEYGVMNLAYGNNPEEECINFLMEASNENALDIIEASFVLIDFIGSKYNAYQIRESRIKIDASTAIELLNTRFKEHNLGYRFENKQLIKFDSEYIHEEGTKPVLKLLNLKEFMGAQEEFLLAHEKLKSGDYKGSIAEANKAFESTMKIICHAKGWKPSKKRPETASNLINLLEENGFFPEYLLNHINSMKNILMGLPTIRNKNGGHGQGVETAEVPEYMAKFALNIAAANIKLLIDLYLKDK